MHTPQVHEPPSTLFCFKPTAAQSNALISGAGGGIGFGAGLTSSFAGVAPGRGASQTVHFSVAEAAFCNMHVSHVQSPPDAAVACFIPAAAQLNPPEGTEGAESVESVEEEEAEAVGKAVMVGFEPGLGSSQATHLSAVPELLTIHTEQLHPTEGGFIPAAAQLNPPDDDVEVDDDDEDGTVDAKESKEEAVEES